MTISAIVDHKYVYFSLSLFSTDNLFKIDYVNYVSDFLRDNVISISYHALIAGYAIILFSNSIILS